ncbi:oxidoreductase [Aspergillus sclerotiicarbonarius CBS 121057]|uniref:Oxidoreductase n=1 Tax=Aspergillus sclerotiicarbonarius (strain CBS 121057 / IBT 28362) TaxID=1448318 RepID=A0A319EPS2_ASPSB|nr:oxidoreductase [Aspergillus sclerotiicarbonarius CBS 121057]
MKYKILGNSRLRVSRIILNFRAYDKVSREGIPRDLPESEIMHSLKYAYDHGINTWDITDCCAEGMSETLIGRALTLCQIPRTRVTIMTKLYDPSLAQAGSAVNDGRLVNQMRLSRENILKAVQGSLTRLNTQYVDVLHLNHMDDTEPKEVMGALDELVRDGKVLYLGASNMLCWQLATLQCAAKMKNWTTFISMRGPYNLLYREGEQEIHPFCKGQEIDLISWSPLANGLLDGQEHFPTHGLARYGFSNEQNQKILWRVRTMASSKGCSMRTLALAWLLKKGVCASVGLQNIEPEAWEALLVDLTDEEMRLLEVEYRLLPINTLELNEWHCS